MLRRPLTSIELKLHDIAEYENMKRELETIKDQGKAPKPYTIPSVWNKVQKSKQEIYARIGYDPQRDSETRPDNISDDY